LHIAVWWNGMLNSNIQLVPHSFFTKILIGLAVS